MIVKKCILCNNYFAAELLSINACCPDHQKYYSKLQINTIKQNRSVPVQYFTVYDTQYPLKKKNCKIYEQVCPVCGKRLLTKKGNYSKRRYCSEHSYYDLRKFNFQFTINDKKIKFREEHEAELILRSLDENKPYYFFCEDCGKSLNYSQTEFHHVVEVHTLTYENLYLLFDINNIKILCHKCHLAHHQSKNKQIIATNQKITDFLGG